MRLVASLLCKKWIPVFSRGTCLERPLLLTYGKVGGKREVVLQARKTHTVPTRAMQWRNPLDEKECTELSWANCSVAKPIGGRGGGFLAQATLKQLGAGDWIATHSQEKRQIQLCAECSRVCLQQPLQSVFHYFSCFHVTSSSLETQN